MKFIYAEIIIFLMLFCFAGITSAEDIPVVSSLTELESIVNSTWVSNSINRLMPPAKDCMYENHLGAVAYANDFDTNFIAELTPVVLYDGTNEFLIYPVEVIETTNGTSRIRNYYSAISTNTAILHSNAISIVNYPIDWIEDIYGEPPTYFSGSAIQDWYDACDPMRQHVLCDLLSVANVTNYLTMLTNSVGYYVEGTNTNSVLVLYSNCIAVVQCNINNDDAELYLHAPYDISMLDVYNSTNLLNQYGWELVATLEHTLDPLRYVAGFDTSSYYSLGNGALDSDGDGLLDARELMLFGTDPDSADSDGDGLSDGEEMLFYRLNPLNSDTDGDGLDDGLEVQQYGTNPLNEDTDGDGLDDGLEVQQGTDPLDEDTDGDGTYDIVELYYGFDPNAFTPEDWDNDGLSNNFEYFYTNSIPTNGIERLNARLFDTDLDKLPDIFEVMYTNFNPCVAHSSTNECLIGDPDEDGFYNAAEMLSGTDPFVSNVLLYNPEEQSCAVSLELTPQDGQDYMMMTTCNGRTNILVSAYNSVPGTIPYVYYPMVNMVDMNFSRNVESSEYMEQFDAVDYSTDVISSWIGFCYRLKTSAITNGIFFFEPEIDIEISSDGTTQDYISPCGIYPSVTPSAFYTAEIGDVTIPSGCTDPKLIVSSRQYAVFQVLYETSEMSQYNIEIEFGSDENNQASLPVNKHFSLNNIMVTPEIANTDAYIRLTDAYSNYYYASLNLPGLNISYHTRDVTVDLPDIVNKRPYSSYELCIDFTGTHCFTYDEYVNISFTGDSNQRLWLSPAIDYMVSTMDSDYDRCIYFDLEGSRCSTQINDTGVEAAFEEEPPTVSDTDYTTVISLDLDIDSDNDDGYDTPEMDSDEEDAQVENSIGKIIKVYRGDVDNDGVPNINDLDHGGEFVPLVVMSHPSATTAEYRFNIPAGIRIWNRDGNDGDRTNNFTRLGGNLIESGYDYGYSELFTGALLSFGSLLGKELYIEGLTSGIKEISCSYILEDTTLFTETVKISVIDVALVPNYDRDSDIDADDLFRYSTNEVYRFWINDDDDDPDKEDGDDKDDVPGDGTADWDDETVIGTTYKIDGTRDLIDFFPVAILGLENALSVLPASEYEYTLWQATESLNLYKTPELSPDEVDKYLYDKDYCLARNRAELYHVEGDDIVLNDFMSNLIDENECVVLFEGREESTSPLVLEIRRKSDNQIVYSTLMRLSISDIEDMYRYLNFRDGGTHITGERQKYPDSLCNDKNVFFIHGVNIEENLARGWNAEIFKRLHWAGSNAKFWGVTWHSDGVNLDDDAYHPNVHIAFETAPTLATTLSSVSNKVILAHSLGNILVSSAIEDHNLQVDKYFMLNAAVAAEAFVADLASTSINNNYMIHENWVGYTSRTWCSQWYELFDLPDKRANLTWRGRFANVVSNAYNYYSSEDEVFEMFEGMPAFWTGIWDTVLGRRYCWQKQELYKGGKSLLNPLGSTPWAGWGFEKTLGVIKYSPQEASNLTTNELRTAPVFNNVLYEAFGPSLYSDSLFSTNLVKTQIDELLAKAIPALSYAAGKTNIVLSFKPDFNSDIADIDRPNGWISRGNPMGNRWLHEDLIDMAYLYNYKLYEQLVQEGDLDD